VLDDVQYVLEITIDEVMDELLERIDETDIAIVEALVIHILVDDQDELEQNVLDEVEDEDEQQTNINLDVYQIDVLDEPLLE
jgi:hypothetical protein